MTKIVWGVSEEMQTIVEVLNKRIPFSGKCEGSRSFNKNLEKFRVAQNCLYDLFNNGLMNRKANFRQIFGGVPISTRPTQFEFDYANRWVEPKFRKIILAAVEEQLGVK